MLKTWPYSSIVVATHNQNKLKQLKEYLQPLGCKVEGLQDYPDCPEVIEDQDTFEGNACKKAEEISRYLGIPVLSDDSGMEVHALDGRPGVFSARYAGPDADDDQNNRKLLQELRDVSEADRQATFVCVMAFAAPGEKVEWVRGGCLGMILSEPRGSKGFGYNPLFYVPAEGKTIAEMSTKEQKTIIHRGKAAQKMMELLRTKYVFPVSEG